MLSKLFLVEFLKRKHSLLLLETFFSGVYFWAQIIVSLPLWSALISADPYLLQLLNVTHSSHPTSKNTSPPSTHLEKSFVPPPPANAEVV